MASSCGGDFALERNDPLPQWDADETLKLPSADETIKDFVPPWAELLLDLDSRLTLLDAMALE